MITVKQIKAARAFLDMSQQELARLAGYSLPTLNNIERQTSSPRPKTLLHIKQALEFAGIQFEGTTGVRLVKEILDTKLLEGSSCLETLYDDIFDFIQVDGGEVLFSNIEENKFLDFDRSTMLKYLKRVGGREDYYQKILFKNGDINFLRPELFTDPYKQSLERFKNAEWRWLPKNLFGMAPMIIYSDKVAHIVWGEHVRVIVVQNKSIAQTYTNQFMALWKIAESIPSHLTSP